MTEKWKAAAGPDPVETLVRRDRIWVVAGLVAAVALAWAYLVIAAADMPDMMSGMGRMAATANAPAWSAGHALATFAMWSIMMVGMMLPGAAPMILMFGLVGRRKREAGHPMASTAVFALGYLIVWTAFSAAATGLQWGLHEATLLSPMMVLASPAVGGGLLIAAGLYQMTPWKNACLARCRAPLHFLVGHWRPGWWGAVRMGVGHGAYCLGCCWLLMALLFVLGVMNLLWVMALTVFVLAEKVVPRGELVSRITGVILICWGIVLIVG